MYLLVEIFELTFVRLFNEKKDSFCSRSPHAHGLR